MSYAVDGTVVTTAAELLKAMKRQGTVYLAADEFDLSAEATVEIHASLVSLTRSTVLLPPDVLAPVVLQTTIYPFEGMTFDGINFMTPTAIPICVPAVGPRVNIYIRRCIFPNLVLAAADFSGFPAVLLNDINANVHIYDTTITSGLTTSADLAKVRRTQYVRTDSTSFNINVSSPITFFTSSDPSADQTLYASNFSMQQTDTLAAPFVSNVGMSIAPFPPNTFGANRADIFNLNAVTNSLVPNVFDTDESVYLINNTFTTPVDPPGSLPLSISSTTPGGVTSLFMDLYGTAASVPSTNALLETDGTSIFYIGQNQYTVAERGAATISAGEYQNGTV